MTAKFNGMIVIFVVRGDTSSTSIANRTALARCAGPNRSVCSSDAIASSREGVTDLGVVRCNDNSDCVNGSSQFRKGEAALASDRKGGYIRSFVSCRFCHRRSAQEAIVGNGKALWASQRPATSRRKHRHLGNKRPSFFPAVLEDRSWWSRSASQSHRHRTRLDFPAGRLT